MHVSTDVSPIVKPKLRPIGNTAKAVVDGQSTETVDRALPKVSRRLVWIEAIHLSDETMATKLFLRRIGDFFDRDGNGSSMSYTQVARECSMSERESKYCAKRARDRWLRIEVGKGHKHAKGRSNLYHAMIPPSLEQQAMANVLARMPRGAAGAPHGGPDGVSVVHPYTVEVDNHLEGESPSTPTYVGVSTGGHGATGNSNVIDFPSIKWGRS